jgi:CelD/BcsL family acetyltransferase involved in cellulose biosynthesis
MLRMIEDLCADPTVEVLDFGFGDAEYKRRLGDFSTREEDVLVYAPTARSVRINLTRTALLLAIGGMRRLAGASALGGAVKRRWRRRLSTASGPDDER